MKLDEQIRQKLWKQIIEIIESYINTVSQTRVTPDTNPEKIRSLLASIKFDKSLDPTEAINFVVKGLWDHQVQVSHPRYFGLFNPAPTSMGIAADTLVSVFNPQLATWSHSPFAIEVEQHLIKHFGSKFGYEESKVEGTFCSGGAEANHTAILSALTHSFPAFACNGLRGIEKQPTLYVSTQSHHSFIKAARLCGLGDDAVRQIPVDLNLMLNIDTLLEKIMQDKANGYEPFLICATAGTTNAGVIDPINEIADIANQMNLWYHVDAAWGGAAILLDEYRHFFDGIERADSITFDTHKWLSVPMGAGLYLSNQKGILKKTFYIKTTYMPPDSTEIYAIDPYIHSIQWSRRFIGLKVFLSLAVAGWEGYRSEIRRQIELGKLLKRELYSSGWEIVNQTILPLVCFIDKKHSKGKDINFFKAILKQIVTPGDVWISIAHLTEDFPVLRACICNYRTDKDDILFLVDTLNEAREKRRETKR